MDLCDVTLREGDQLPGRSYTVDQKLAAAGLLDDLGVPYVQAGFPATGERDREVVSTLATSLSAEVVSIARAVPGDVEAALAAESDVIEVFAPISDLQLEHVLDTSLESMLGSIREAVELAGRGASAHLCLVDAFRTDERRVAEAIDRFEADVAYVNLADTVGIATPSAVEVFLGALRERSDLAPSRLGVHFHDDLGVGTANVMRAYEAGVGKADVSVAALGERAGNASLEEVVALADLGYDDDLGIDAAELIPRCRGVLETLGEGVEPRKSLLGELVTQHESGIHTAAMLDEPSVYEPFDPARFGGERTLVFGEGTGRGACSKLLDRAGVEVTDERVSSMLALLAERGPMDTDEAVALAAREYGG